MKKSLIALAVLAASGAAMAQSSVTVFGIADVAAGYVDGGNSWSGLSSGQNATSRIGFRGVEDLGGGLKAGFWLEAGVNVDNGDGASGYTGATAGSGVAFRRRSTVSLESGWGELRLGRDLTEAYKATSRYDVFGQVGFGVSKLWADADITNTYTTSQRVSNMITYVSPAFAGIRVAGNYGFGETANVQSTGQYYGGAVTFDNGPISLGVTAEKLDSGYGYSAANGTTVNLPRDITTYSVGGSFNFGLVKLAGAYRQATAEVRDTNVENKTKGYYVGLSAPIGAGEIKASYNRYELDTAGNPEADHYSLGYVHNLSKRTAVYGTYSYIKNKNGGSAFNISSSATLDNGKQQGVQVGLRHAF